MAAHTRLCTSHTAGRNRWHRRARAPRCSFGLSATISFGEVHIGRITNTAERLTILVASPDTTPALAVGRLLATRFATHKFWQPSTTAGPTGAGSASGSGSAGTHSRDPLHSPSSPHINSPEPCRWNPSSHITLHSLPNAVWQECRLNATTWSSAEKISLSARSLLRCCQE